MSSVATAGAGVRSEQLQGDGFVAALAGARLAIRCGDRELLSWVYERFAGFTVGGPAEWLLEMTCAGEPPACLQSPREVHAAPMEITATAAGLLIESASYRAEIDLDRRRVRLVGPRATFPVDGVLRVLLPLMVEDGLLLHGGMLVDGPRAWAFSGPSGSGKSTLCELLGRQARCDEMVAVRRLGGRWVAQSMPFWKARPAMAEVEGLLILEHGAIDRKTPLAPAEAGRLLARELLWPLADPAALTARFRLFSALLAEVPLWRLSFRPTPAVWSVIAESAA